MKIHLCTYAMPLLAAALFFSGCKSEPKLAASSEPSAVKGSASRRTTIVANKSTAAPAKPGGGALSGAPSRAGDTADASSTESVVSVHGRVTTAGGSPAADVAVDLHGYTMEQLQQGVIHGDGDPVATSVTNREGEYEVKGPIGIGMHLRVKGNAPPMMAMLEHQDLNVRSGSRKGNIRIKLDIELLPGNKISGSVINESGQPMPGLPIHLKPKFEQGDKRLLTSTETTSTASGTFELDQVADGTWLIGTAHPEYAATLDEITVPTTDPITIRLAARGGTVTGHVHHKQTGSAVPGLKLRLNPLTMHSLEKLDKYETETAGDGTFKFDHVSSGPKRIWLADDKELGFALPLPSAVVVNEQETTDIQLLVYAGHTITGRVFDKDTDDPLPGAVVGIGDGPAPMRKQATTDASGIYRLPNIFPMGSPQVRLTVKLDGYEEENASPFNRSEPVVLKDDGTEATKDIPMVHTVKIRGLVVTKDEVPVAHAQVALYNNRNYGSSDQNVNVNPDGSFELMSPPFVSAVVEATASGYGPVVSESIEVTTKDVEGIKLIMDVGSIVQGRVLNPAGEPIAGAAVNQNRQYGIFSTSREATVSGEKGDYILKDLPKQVTLKGKKTGYAASEELELSLKPGETRTGADLTLRQGHIISGRVVNSSGQTVPGVSINAQGPENVYEHKNTDQHGKFEFNELVEGAYRISASKDGESKNLQGINTGTENLEIVLEKPSTTNGEGIKFVGTVLDDLSGEPITDFTVEASSNLQVKKLTEPGKFELVGVQRRFGYDVTLSSEGYMKQKYDTESSQDGSDVNQTFRLGRGGIITGRVIEKATGKPVPDLVVINWGKAQQHERQREGPQNHSSTDEEGKFVLAPAPSGTNTVEFKPAAPLSELSKTVEVKSEQTADMGDIELSTGGSIHGIVVRGANEEPVADQAISLSGWSREMQVSRKATSDAEGKFEFATLPPMNYTVQADSISKSVELAADASADVKLVIGGVTISGVVTRGGAPVRASVNGSGPNGQRISAYAEAGEYTIKSVMPGKYEFSVHPQDGGNYNSAARQTVDVPDQAEFKKDFQLPDGKIDVTVVDSSGAAVPGANVSLTQKSSNTGFNQRWLSQVSDSQRTNSDGQVLFEGLDPGVFSITARKEGVGTAMKPDVQLTDSQAAQVQLQLSNEGGTLVSVALSYATGQGIPEAWCYLYGEGGQFTHDGKRDAAGQMVIENIPPGTYTTNVSYWSHSQSERQVEIKANETARIEDVLYPAGALHWTLQKADGSPAAGAAVTVTPVTTDPPEEPRTGATAQNGLFVQRGLAGGTYQVTAQLEGKPAVTETFTVTAGANEQKATTVPTW